MEHLLSAWTKVAEQLKSARRVLLLTDYDGTLTPIVERPELANLPAGAKLILQALAGKHDFRVGIISGRALVDLKEKVGISGIIYAGNHGLEIEGPGIEFVNSVAEEIRPFLRLIYYILSRSLATIRGVLIEDKGLSLSVHYRLAERHKTEEVGNIVQRVVGGAEAMGGVKVTSGKEVWEIRPDVNWDKGKAIRLLMKRYGKGGWKSGLLPIYLGDDLTDEDGFRVIEDYGSGISIFVGEPVEHSMARYFLRSPLEVSLFLGRLIELNRRDFLAGDEDAIRASPKEFRSGR